MNNKTPLGLCLALILFITGCNENAPPKDQIQAAFAKTIPAHLNIQAIEVQQSDRMMSNVKLSLIPSEDLYQVVDEIRIPESTTGNAVRVSTLKSKAQQPLSAYGKIAYQKNVDKWELSVLSLEMPKAGLPQAQTEAKVAGSPELKQEIEAQTQAAKLIAEQRVALEKTRADALIAEQEQISRAEKAVNDLKVKSAQDAIEAEKKVFALNAARREELANTAKKIFVQGKSFIISTSHYDGTASFKMTVTKSNGKEFDATIYPPAFNDSYENTTELYFKGFITPESESLISIQSLRGTDVEKTDPNYAFHAQTHGGTRTRLSSSLIESRLKSAKLNLAMGGITGICNRAFNGSDGKISITPLTE